MASILFQREHLRRLLHSHSLMVRSPETGRMRQLLSVCGLTPVDLEDVVRQDQYAFYLQIYMVYKMKFFHDAGRLHVGSTDTGQRRQ
jgi:hypothetical protein